MNCSRTFPLPEQNDRLLVLHGDPGVTKNFAMSAILHCVNVKRFCYYIGNANGSFENLTAFDKCTFKAESNVFLIPKSAETAEVTVQRLQEVDRKTNPALVIVEVPENCSPYGIVNILGYMQDLRIRLKMTCLVLVNESEVNSLLSERLLDFYKLTVYEAFRWGLKSKSGEAAVEFVEDEGRLVQVR